MCFRGDHSSCALWMNDRIVRCTDFMLLFVFFEHSVYVGYIYVVLLLWKCLENLEKSLMEIIVESC